MRLEIYIDECGVISMSSNHAGKVELELDKRRLKKGSLGQVYL